MIKISKKNNRWEYIVLAMVGLFIYQFGFQNEFTNWDTPLRFPGNVFDYPLSLTRVYTIFTNLSDKIYSVYQPLPELVFHIFNAISKQDPLYFHIFSCVIHIFNSWLVFIFCRILLKNRLKSFFIALLFVSNPLAVEAVSWVAATSTPMFTFCFLVSLIAYLKYKNQGNKYWYFFSLTMFFLGLLCKIQIVPLIIIFSAIDYFLTDSSCYSTRNILEKIPFVILTCFLFYINEITQVNQQSIGAGSEAILSLDFYNLILMVPYQYFWYVVKLLFPSNLSAVYEYPEKLSIIYYLAIILTFPLLWVSVHKKTKKIILFGIIFYTANIIITTNALSIFRAPYANRYSYVACLGVFIVLLHIVNRKYKKLVYLFCFILVCSNIFLSIKQVHVWKNSVTLWTENLKYGDKNDSYIGLGLYYEEKKEYQKAIDYYLKIQGVNAEDSKILELQQNCKAIRYK